MSYNKWPSIRSRTPISTSPNTGCSASPVSFGQARCTTAALAQGANTVTGMYSGDTNFLGSSGTVTQNVN